MSDFQRGFLWGVTVTVGVIVLLYIAFELMFANQLGLI